MSLHYLGKCWNAKIVSFLSHVVLVHCQTSTGRWLNLFSLVTHNSCCCCCVALKILSLELSCGSFWGRCPETNEDGCLHCSSWTVLNAISISALYCRKVKLPLMTHFVASNICWDSKIFHQNCQLVFTPRLVKNNSHFDTAIPTPLWTW